MDRFLPFGVVPRGDAQCPVCGSIERHRLAWLFLKRELHISTNCAMRLLHFAPEAELMRRLQQVRGLDYVTADLTSSRAQLKLDITEIALPDASFDLVYCSHVLEHVPEDRKAMREIWRVLRPGGAAAIMLPFEGETTFEDPTVTDPKERLRLFGQVDHVRRYGVDVVERLRDAGFDVKVISPSVYVSEREMRSIGLKDEPVLLCRRRTHYPMGT
ncbi:MAG: methyltransferase domain-containing protein [Deltaproteobacteria bacterium]|nr:methyltransferase domain-containing protein [Deltaproteobacteria bacterium]